MTEMLKDEASRTKFVNDSVQFLRKFEFDGLDLDFECMFIFNPIISYYFYFIGFYRSWCEPHGNKSYFPTRR
jgi:hypothetical protein